MLKIDFKKFDLLSFINATNRQKNIVSDYIDKIKNLTEDSKKEDRRSKMECSACFYLFGKIGGSAMTTAYCGLCEAKLIFCNTCTDKLCFICAKINNLCKHCGADFDLKFRRKKELKTSNSAG